MGNASFWITIHWLVLVIWYPAGPHSQANSYFGLITLLNHIHESLFLFGTLVPTLFTVFDSVPCRIFSHESIEIHVTGLIDRERDSWRDCPWHFTKLSSAKHDSNSRVYFPNEVSRASLQSSFRSDSNEKRCCLFSLCECPLNLFVLAVQVEFVVLVTH